ncbi:MAG: ACT domain-containing protein [Actinomycetes bacterium]
MTFTLRIAVTDRPGSLARISTALARVGANIVTLEVLERSVETAVDQLVIEAPRATGEVLRRVLEQIPGTVVESLRPTRGHAGLPPLGLAARLARTTPDELLTVLVDGLTVSFDATWSAVVASREPQPEVRASSAGTPSFLNVATPWLPLRDVRRIPPGPWTPSRWGRAGEPLELAAAPLRDADEALLVARPYGPRFAGRELADIGMLAEVTVGLLARADATVTPGASRA